MEHIELWFKFTVAALIVVSAGLSLTKKAEKLAQALGWSHAFAGFVILGWATSLPELTISVSAVTEVGSPALAMGNITGSLIFNLAILALLDLKSRHQRETRSPGEGITPLGVFNLVLLAGMLAIMWWPTMATGALSRSVGFFLIAGYLATSLHAWFNQKSPRVEEIELYPRFPWDLVGGCLLSGGMILGAGVWLAHIGNDLASTYQLEEGLVGTLFLACISSLPELVTGFGAVKLGLLTMAAGSILGSNIFNLGILGVCDLIFQTGEQAGTSIVVAANDPRMTQNVLAALIMTALALVAVRLRAHQASGDVRLVLALVILLVYAVALI